MTGKASSTVVLLLGRTNRNSVASKLSTMTASPDLYCVLGNPIAHSRSPWIHTRFADLTGERMRYESRLVPVDSFAQALAQLTEEGVRGCNVTVPFKREAAALADQRSQRVQLAGAANTLSLSAGTVQADNTDGLGLVADITRGAGFDLAGRDVLLIGAGGAAAGALGALLAAGPRRIVLVNRTLATAQALVAAHAELAALQKVELLAHGLQGLEQDFDLVINASASSLGGTGVPVSAQVLRRGGLAYDMMYGPDAEGFVQWARAAGAQARDGLGMLVEQAAEAFFIWRGMRPPATQVLAELRAMR